MKENPRVDSALHVLKGALQKRLGATLTTGVWGEGTKGRLAVEYDGEVSDGQIAEIEGLANAKIGEDVAIETEVMERAEAERVYGAIIYDRFPVPARVTTLTIVRIGGWNVNCCLGPHVPRTGAIGAMRIAKYRNRRSRKELEVSFELQDPKP